MMIGIIAIIFLVVLGLLCIIFPNQVLRADKRDDPEAISQARKGGLLLIMFAIGAGLLLAKYELF